jgi:streptogramin lyase
MIYFPCFRSLVYGVAVVLSSALLGCGVSPTSNSPVAGAAFNGRVIGGQQPISGAQIFLYAAGSSGPGAGAVSLLTNPVFTDGQGNFSITNDFNCSSSTQVYLLAQGGNPGLTGFTSNPAILLSAAIGNCGSLTQSSFITINEVTTVAAAWALAPFLSAGGVVGSTNSLSLQNAFANANKLVNIATGTAGGAALSAGTTIEAAKLNTLANALSACVNSNGTTACGPLFAAATVGANAAPSNTLQAARNVVLNPGNNVVNVFNAAPAQPPFAPGLSSAPNDWTMSITYTGGGLDEPTGVAVDSLGDVWAANFFGNMVTEISPAGQLQSFFDSNLNESLGIAVDSSNNVWVTNEESTYSVNDANGSISEFNSSGQLASGSPFTAGGIYYPYAIAADTDGSVWIADYGDSAATHLAANGTSLSGASGYKSNAHIPSAGSVAVDGSHNAWFGALSQVAKVTTSGAISSYTCCQQAGGVAVDPSGNIWLADYSDSSVVEFNSNGAFLQTLTGTGGTYFPYALAIDAGGNVWIANYRGQTISVVTAGGAALSPSYGFGLDAAMNLPFGIAVDSSGSVWVTNKLADAVTQFVGLAAPTATPLLGPPGPPPPH